MGIGSGERAKGGSVLLYRSTDLRAWEYLHPLASGKSNSRTADPVDSGEMWECPDFFPLGKKHALLYATERKVYWETGEFDRQERVFYSEKRGLLDAGAFYAPKSQLAAKERRILWGWIPETRPEAEFSAAGWAGSMSLPRVLSLAADNTLTMEFLPELAKLRSKEFALPGRPQGDEARRNAFGKLELRETACEIELQIHREKLDLRLSDGASAILSLAFDPGRPGAELRVGEKSAGVAVASGGEHKLRIFLDASVVECIVDGSRALTERCYAVPKGTLRLNILEQGLDAITTLRVWELNPISKDRLTS